MADADLVIAAPDDRGPLRRIDRRSPLPVMRDEPHNEGSSLITLVEADPHRPIDLAIPSGVSDDNSISTRSSMVKPSASMA